MVSAEPETEHAYLQMLQLQELHRMWVFAWEQYVCRSLPLRDVDGQLNNVSRDGIAESVKRLDALADQILLKLPVLGDGGTTLLLRIEDLQSTLDTLADRVEGVGRKPIGWRRLLPTKDPLAPKEWRIFRRKISRAFERANSAFKKLIKQANRTAFPRSLLARILGRNSVMPPHLLNPAISRRIRAAARQSLVGAGLVYASKVGYPKEVISALEHFGVPPWTTLAEVDEAFERIHEEYKRMSFSTHPDRGGDAEAFLATQRHYQTICRWVRRDA